MLGPSVHHEHIIDARNSNRVDALGKDLRGMLQIARQMVVLAGRGKRARYGKQDNLAVLEEFVGRLRGGTVLGHDPECYFWQALADGNRHTLHPWVSEIGHPQQAETWLFSALCPVRRDGLTSRSLLIRQPP